MTSQTLPMSDQTYFRECCLAISNGEQPNWKEWSTLGPPDEVTLFNMLVKLNDIDVVMGYIEHAGRNPTSVMDGLQEISNYLLPEEMSESHWETLVGLARKDRTKGVVPLVELLLRSAAHHDRPDMMNWAIGLPEVRGHAYSAIYLFGEALRTCICLDNTKTMLMVFDILHELGENMHKWKNNKPAAFALWEAHKLKQVLHQEARSDSETRKPKVI